MSLLAQESRAPSRRCFCIGRLLNPGPWTLYPIPMDSLTFKPGRAFLSSNSPTVPWTAVFEDEGPAGYFYACDRSRETHDESILDAMLIYTGSSLEDRERERLASVQ